MREIEWWVKRELLPYINDELKTLDVWPNSRKLPVVSRGDVLIINRQVERLVVGIRHYSSFETALNQEDFRRIYPPAQSRADLLRLWRTIYPVRAERHGVLVFEWKRMR